LVSSLSRKGLEQIPGFGSSDCRSGCMGHLLYLEGPFASGARQVVSSFRELGLCPEVLELKTLRSS
jgi:Uri superfamily endonuclease